MLFDRLGEHFLVECRADIFDVCQHDGACWNDMSFGGVLLTQTFPTKLIIECCRIGENYCRKKPCGSFWGILLMGKEDIINKDM